MKCHLSQCIAHFFVKTSSYCRPGIILCPPNSLSLTHTHTLSRGQFHQCSMHSFYTRKLRAQVFLCLSFRFVLYWRKTVCSKAARRTLVKLALGLEYGKSSQPCHHYQSIVSPPPNVEQYKVRPLVSRLQVDLFIHQALLCFNTFTSKRSIGKKTLLF